MGSLLKRERRTPTHVAGLLLTTNRTDVRACFVMPTAALRDGRGNHTVPGGGIHQTGAKRFETPEQALIREAYEEIGCPTDNWRCYLRIGEPVVHVTGRGEKKVTQSFVGIVYEPYSEPRLKDEITAVDWCEQTGWFEKLTSMNSGKRQLVLHMMQEAASLGELFPCMRRSIRTFLADYRSEFALT
jgi:8-oxo-dGTP pyrophosphatase MutT (NUDIX family)